jgi:hypothetical protein
LLREIVSLKLPPDSDLHYSEYGADYLEDLNQYLVYISAFRLRGSPPKFSCINMEAQMKPNTLDVDKEVIRLSVDTIEHGYQITLEGKEIGLRHKRLLRSILEKKVNRNLLQTKDYHP